MEVPYPLIGNLNKIPSWHLRTRKHKQRQYRRRPPTSKQLWGYRFEADLKRTIGQTPR
jgi:hypothetical protein